jgi:ATPase subunit of ABC transporter with duplicated ATPase domains
VSEILRESPSKYTEWVKVTEAEAWRDGHRVAGERQQRLREIENRVRKELRVAQKSKQDTEAEELERMMSGLAVRKQEEQAATAQRFAERETKLWAVSISGGRG